MNDEVKHKIKTILATAQAEVDKLVSGLKVTAVVLEKAESPEELVQRALQDRNIAGLDASNASEVTAPLTLDSVPESERDLIERALQKSHVVADLEK